MNVRAFRLLWRGGLPASCLWLWVASVPAGAAEPVHWQHPAGLVTSESIAEVRHKLATQEWARKVFADRKAALDTWLTIPSAELQRVFPRQRGNVYHNFSCPTDRIRLKFNPFNPDRFECPSCGKTFDPQTDAGIYAAGDRYHACMYEGWVCLFFLEAAANAADLALIGRIEANDRCMSRGIEILMLHADMLEKLQVKPDPDPQMRVLLTYHREGDSMVLFDLARAYELLRDRMTIEQRQRYEHSVLQRMLDDIMLEPIYRYNHNNLYQWHRTIVQTAVALQRDDLIDWSFGYGDGDPEHQPEHRSIRRLAATHFKPDGAYWEMCSGYHLYPLHFFCDMAIVSHHLSRMDPKRFPAKEYDLTDLTNPSGTVIRNGLHWFMSMAMPDRRMPTVGDSMAPWAGMDDYVSTAEAGYRFYGVREIGDYPRFRNGERSWTALLVGALKIEQVATPFTSSHLSSGWVSLRREWKGDRIWVGLNALIPGGGHQHADRLGLLTYAQGQLLALEKATPYNDAATRELGTLSYSHNTVTVDQQSQAQGEALTPEQVPQVAYFFAPPTLAFAELRGDRIYPQTQVYRRSVALIEDVVVDSFSVVGGKTHDWMIHHAGSAPRLSVPETSAEFTPAAYIANGGDVVRLADGGTDWDARWSARGVTSRLTMLGAPGTQVYALETYPIDNARVDREHPAGQTLCVRRTNDVPFVAVWDAWKEAPSLAAVHAGDTVGALSLKTSAGQYWIRFGPGRANFEDGVALSSDAVFTCISSGAVTWVGGSKVEFQSQQGTLLITSDARACVSAEYAEGTLTLEFAGDIQYDTLGGEDRYREPPVIHVEVEGNLWPVKQRQQRFAGRVKPLP